MRLTARQTTLATLLMKQKGIKKAREYANQLNISERTLYEDLKHVETHLSTLGYRIERKTGVGIRVNREDDNLYSQTNRQLSKEIDDRRLYILKILLFQEHTITFEKLSQILLVSKSSIKVDFETIRKYYLKDTCCSLHSDMNGTRFLGNEEQLQRTFAQFNELCFKHIEPLLPTTEDRLNLLKDLYGNDIVNSAYAVLYQLTIRKFPLIAEYYMLNILNVLIILTYRSKQGFHMSEVMERCTSKKLQVFTREILTKIEELQQVTFTEDDAIYFMKNLVANRMESQDGQNPMKDVISNIVCTMSTALDVDLKKDDKLLEQLEQHVPAMIYRLKENIQVQNPFLSQIKSEFTLMYHLTWLALSSLEDMLGIHFTQDEIGFVMLYFQLALDRIQPCKRVLIVCPLGLSTSEMLSNQIAKLLPPLDIVYHSSIQEITDLDIEQIDFIISTVELNMKIKPYVVVSPLLNNEDIKNISELYNTKFVLNKEQAPSRLLQHIPYFIDASCVQVNCTFETKDEVVSYMCNTLYEKGYVKEAFINSVLKREHLGSTDLASQVAIPHGNPMYVNKTIISILVLKTPIKWEEEYVRVVILLGVAQADIQLVKGILKEVYKLAASKEAVDKNFLNKDKKEVLRLLGGTSI